MVMGVSVWIPSFKVLKYSSWQSSCMELFKKLKSKTEKEKGADLSKKGIEKGTELGTKGFLEAKDAAAKGYQKAKEDHEKKKQKGSAQ